MKKGFILVLFMLFCSILFSQGSNEISFFQDRNHYGVITESANSEIAMNGSNMAVEEYYPFLQVDVLKITSYSETEALIRSAIDSNYDALFTIGTVDSILRDLAYENPDKRFASISDTISSSLPENYTEFYFDLYSSSYLSGIAAYFLSSTNKVGIIAYNDSAYIKRGIDGFLAGVEEAGTNCNVVVYVLDDNAEENTINAIIDRLIYEGVDIVFSLLGDNVYKVITKAEEKDLAVISGDKYIPSSSTSSVVLSCFIDLEKAISLMIGRIKEGERGGISIPIGLEDGVVDLSWFIDESEVNRINQDIRKVAINLKTTLRRYKKELENGSQLQ